MPNAFFMLRGQTLHLTGSWTLEFLPELVVALDGQSAQFSALKAISGGELQLLDSSGALLLQKLKHRSNWPLVDFQSHHIQLLNLVEKNLTNETVEKILHHKHSSVIAHLGRGAVRKMAEFFRFVKFIGQASTSALEVVRKFRKIYYQSIVEVFESAGVDALPIVALLSFLIGIVLTYQMGRQLQVYGANIYLVDALGVSLFREFSPLITAIIVAGRTGSAFTAQIGTMKINEEMDALQVMGFSPLNILVFPRIFALIFCLPLLTCHSALFGLLGGMFMGQSLFHITYNDFFTRLQYVTSINSFFTGMIKTPLFGATIASIGCFRGFLVTGGSVGLGRETTTSVVQSIFFIIVIDAMFSIIFGIFGV